MLNSGARLTLIATSPDVAWGVCVGLREREQLDHWSSRYRRDVFGLAPKPTREANASRRFREPKSAPGLCRGSSPGVRYECITNILAMLAPGQYEIVEMRTRRGVTRVLLLPKAILQSELEAEGL